MMKRFFILVLAAFLAGAGPAAAVAAEAEGAPAGSAQSKSLRSWFGHWRAALQKKAIQARYRRGVSVTTVAAVRGSKQSEADPKLPYWKGSWTDKKAAERLQEREEQAAAIDLILAGKFAQAEKALAAFEQAHPKSAYLADIKEARGRLEELKKAETPEPAPAPEPKPAVVEEKKEAAKEEIKTEMPVPEKAKAVEENKTEPAEKKAEEPKPAEVKPAE